GQGHAIIEVSRAVAANRADLGNTWAAIQGVPPQLFSRLILSRIFRPRILATETKLAFYPPIAVSPNNANRAYFGTSALWVGQQRQGQQVNDYSWDIVG